MLTVLIGLFIVDTINHTRNLRLSIDELRTTAVEANRLTTAINELTKFSTNLAATLGRAAKSKQPKPELEAIDRTKTQLEIQAPVPMDFLLGPAAGTETVFLLAKQVKAVNGWKSELRNLAISALNTDPGSSQFQALVTQASAADQNINFLALEIPSFASLHSQKLVAATQAANAQHEKHLSLLTFLAILVCSLIALLERLWLVVPLSRFSRALTSPDSRETRYTERNSSRRDEVGILANAIIQHHQDNQARQQAGSAKRQRVEAELARKKKEHEESRNFSHSVSQILERLEQHASRMHGEAEALASAANSANDETKVALQSVTVAADNASLVSKSIHEVTKSSSDIHSQIIQATQSIKAASQAVNHAGIHTQSLTDGTHAIETVIALIQSVAERTNLLALNATIEAARAGDVGRGFSVVASEIKTLATQTSTATNDILAELNALVERAGNVADLMKNIVHAVKEIETASQAIATSVETQTGATSEIDKAARHSASESDNLQRGLDGVAILVADADQTANSVLAVSDDLTNQAVALRNLVSAYLQSTAEDNAAQDHQTA